MIPRYTRPEMAAIWAPETRLRIWFEIEAHATDAMVELGLVPEEAAKALGTRAERLVSTLTGSMPSKARSSMT